MKARISYLVLAATLFPSKRLHAMSPILSSADRISVRSTTSSMKTGLLVLLISGEKKNAALRQLRRLQTIQD